MLDYTSCSRPKASPGRARRDPDAGNVTAVLDRMAAGDARAVDDLMPLVYDELRSLAGRFLRGEGPGHTLEGTALVHEAYVRMVEHDGRSFVNRAHFMGAAATAIRRILVEHARRRSRLKRGGGQERIPLEQVDVPAVEHPAEWIALDEALERLEAIDPTKIRVVELRFFAGLTVEEVATVLGVSASTVARDWRFARAWLRAELEERDSR